EDVEAPAPRDGGRDRRLDIVARGHVAADREAARRRLGLVEVGDHDRRALRGESRRSRRADASRAAGDERRLPLEPHACGSVTGWYFARTSSTYAARRSAIPASLISSTFSAFRSPLRERLNDPTNVVSSHTAIFA